MKPSDIIDEPALFGRIDGVTRIHRQDAVLETYEPRAEEFVTRSIDSWASVRPSVRFIHFGDPQMTLDQLDGAMKTLERDRPIVSLYPAGLPRRSVLNTLEGLSYQVVDVGLNPVRQGPTNSRFDFGWIAIPAERQDEVKTAIPQDALANSLQFSEEQEIIERNSVARQHRSRAVFGLPPNAVQLFRNFSATEVMVEDDCYPAESDGVNWWRWLGPRPRTRFMLPCLLPGLYQGEFVVLASHLRSGLGSCRILAEGREVRTAISGIDSGGVRFLGQLQPQDYAGYMSVDIISPGTVTSIPNEPRTLRLSVQSVSLAPWR